MTYTVDFVLHGHFYVDDIEAESKDEAMDKWSNEDFIYKEENPEVAYEVGEFEVEE